MEKQNKKAEKFSPIKKANKFYYFRKKEMIPKDKCYACVENEMIVHRLLVNMPKANDSSRGAFEHYYLLRKLTYELSKCNANSMEEKEYYARLYVWADIMYRLLYREVEEKNKGYELPPFPAMPKFMKAYLLQLEKKNPQK